MTLSKVSFYYCKEVPLFHTVYLLARKAWKKGLLCDIVTYHKEQVELIDDKLWTLKNNSFLPHSSLQKTLTIEQEPCLIYSEEESLTVLEQRKALYSLWILGSNPPKGLKNFDQAAILFTEVHLQGARALWQSLKHSKTMELSYYAYSEGTWSKKS